ncbi:hypothetical protein F6X37_32365 [Paraburkholderia sp. 31.1]|uniref:hypothetical protein n=1 Tax=Paraburkholderia sp. 31.1 TaxID=2615205 RepID=UPI00165616DD|nr:hypothetical protein [Paraburkholderia sp. 31.1]MBC8726063.1 hypothetical protein [Paraburkholderia sp. 31.1]
MEPRFTPGEVAILLASRRAEREPRGRHGIPLAEALDPANQFAYEPVGPNVDWAQSTINEAEAAFEKNRAKGDHRAVMFGVRRRQAFSNTTGP